MWRNGGALVARALFVGFEGQNAVVDVVPPLVYIAGKSLK
jgi:hypothetical protein